MKAIILTCLSCLLLMQCSDQNSNSSDGIKGASSSDASATINAAITPFKNIDVAQMKAVAENLGKDQVIIDVRTPDEINKGYIKGTININYYLADFEDKIKALDKDKEYYVYCRSGGRSTKASKLMNKLGFNKVYNLEGGYQAWEKNK
jgi:rhodanese-related sulfurtransferase